MAKAIDPDGVSKSCSQDHTSRTKKTSAKRAKVLPKFADVISAYSSIGHGKVDDQVVATLGLVGAR